MAYTAPETAIIGPDSSLIWCVERLLEAEEFSDSLVDNVLGVVFAHAELPPIIHLRMCLRALGSPHSLTAEGALSICQQLATLSSDLSSQIPRSDILLPSSELLLMLRTEVVVQYWKNGLRDPHEIQNYADTVFANCASDFERARLNDLHIAAISVDARGEIERSLPPSQWQEAAKAFAAQARNWLPKSVLRMINDDVNARRYMPGQSSTVPQRSVPATVQQQQYQPPPQHFASINLMGTTGLMGTPRHQPTAAVPAVAALPTAAALGSNRRRARDDYEEDYRTGVGAVAASPVQTTKRNRTALESARQNLVSELNQHPDPLLAARQLAGTIRPVPHADAFRLTPLAQLDDEDDDEDELGPPIRMEALPLQRPAPLHRNAVAGGQKKKSGITPGRKAPVVKRQVNEENRRVKIYWTQEETDALIEGVLKHGVGNWALILQDDEDHVLVKRNQVDLKDKWRNLLKVKNLDPRIASYLGEEPEAEAAENGEEIEDADGDGDNADE